MVCMFVHTCVCVYACTRMYTYTLYGAHVQVREQFALLSVPFRSKGQSWVIMLDGKHVYPLVALNNGLVLCHYL